MRVIRGFEQLQYPILDAVVTLGNFDGVHLAHQEMLRLARKIADVRKGQLVVLTFRPHPQTVLAPATPLELVSTYDQKLDLLLSLGVDWVIEQPFTQPFSELSPEVFFKDMLVERLGTKAIVVGYDFAFGHKRHGHLDLLEKLCHSSGVELHMIPAQVQEEGVISSSRIRHLLHAGEMEAVKRLLGRTFTYRGKVLQGHHRGRTLGFPTANIQVQNQILLPYGVYVSETQVGLSRYESITHIGVRPTFGTEESTLWVESHLFDFHQDLYGIEIEISFLHWLRKEQQFADIESMKTQLKCDVKAAKVFLQRQNLLSP